MSAPDDGPSPDTSPDGSYGTPEQFTSGNPLGSRRGFLLRGPFTSAQALWQRRSACHLIVKQTRSNNGGAEARSTDSSSSTPLARGFRNYGNHRLRMLFVGGGLGHPHLK